MLGRTSAKTLTGIDQNRLNEQELKTIQLEIQEIETEIEQIQAEQLIQNADILQNSADIAVNAQGVASNLASITALNAEQVVQNTSINTNAQGIASNLTSITALNAEQLVQNTSIASNTQNINLNSIDIDDLETRADNTDAHQAVQDAQISTLQTTVGNNFQTLLDELNDIQQQVYGNDADIVALDIRITENRNKIDELEFYQFNVLMSLFYTKDETNGLFVSLRGTYSVGTIGELKTNLEAIISALDTNTAASLANLQGQITANDGDISALQSTTTSLQGQITANDGDISALQSTTTSLQGQITANDGDISSLQSQINSNDGEISSLQTKSQHLTSNTINTFISSNLDVGQTLAVTGTVPENPAIIIRDAANANAMITMDALSLSAQGNPIIQSNDSSILTQNTDQSGVLVLSSTGPKRCGVRIAKDFIDEFADTCNFKNSDNNLMTSIVKTTPTSSILSHNTIIRTDYVRYRSPVAGYAVSGVPNGSYDQIVPLISSTVSFVPNNTIDFFILLPGFRIEAYSGAGYTGNQNIYSNVDSNLPLNVSAIGPDTMSSIKVFYKSMDGSESEILILL